MRGIRARRIDDVYEQPRPRDVPQKLDPEASAAGRTFDQPGKIRHHVGVVADLDNTEIWLERREWVVRDLRRGTRKRRKQRRFSGVRQPDKPDVGDQLQFEREVAFFAALPRLRDIRRLVRRRREVLIAAATAAAARDDET